MAAVAAALGAGCRAALLLGLVLSAQASAATADPVAVRLVRLLPADETGEGLQEEDLRAMAGSANAWLARQAGRRVRFVLGEDGTPDVATLRLPLTAEEVVAAGDGAVARLATAVEAAYPDPDLLIGYAYGGPVALRSPTHCGRRVGRAAGLFPRNPGCRRHPFAGGDAQGWDKILLHELFHALGAVAACAPNADAGRHVVDSPDDLLHANGGGRLPRLDVGRDDYFGHGRADCPDLARSELLE